MWKKLFALSCLLLAISLAISTRLWDELEAVKTRPYVAPPELADSSGSGSRLEATAPLTDASLEISALKSQLAASEEGRKQTLERYEELRQKVHGRLGWGEDALTFVTPESPAVSSLVKEIVGGLSDGSKEYWQNLDRLFRWITLNITYNQDTYTPLIPASPGESLTWTEEFWRFPEETLRDKVGDCEDLSTLLASMILNYNKGQYSVWVLVMGNQVESHVAVALPVANKMLTIMDPTAYYVTGPNTTVLASKDIATAVNDWLSHWAKKIPEAQVKSVFNHKFRQDFESTKEFIDWANKQIK